MTKMNKILKSLLSVAVISASLASCSQVDSISEIELEEKKTNTTITLNLHSDWPQTTTVVFATNTMGSFDKAFYHKGNAMEVPVGKYKFYAVNRNRSYEYENLNFDKLSKDTTLYYGNVLIASKTNEYTTSDEGVQKVLSGKYVSRNAGEIFADSTMLVNVGLGQNVNVTFQKPYKLTTQYTISGSFTSSRAAQSIYLEICDIVAKKRPNGTAVAGKKAKCVFAIGGAAKDTKKEFEQTMTVLGVPQKGTANIYVRFKGDEKSTTPEQKSVQYTVSDGIIKLGDITF